MFILFGRKNVLYKQNHKWKTKGNTTCWSNSEEILYCLTVALAVLKSVHL